LNIYILAYYTTHVFINIRKTQIKELEYRDQVKKKERKERKIFPHASLTRIHLRIL